MSALSLAEKTIVIVGLGKIGSLYAACYGQAGHRVRTVDLGDGADWDRVDEVPDPSDVDAWVVATPTATHLTVVDEILRLQPDARILLEKPACYPDELDALVRTVLRHPRARIIVNDVYSHSEAVQRFAASVREAGEFDPIRKVTIEFTKNREFDVANGRFVDTQYGEAGYEGFHMLSILRAVLPADQYRTYLRTAPSSVTAEMRVLTSAIGLPDVELYTSSTGAVAFPALAGFAFPEDVSRDFIAPAAIPYGSEFRYRFADVEFHSGKHVTLVFEPFFGSDLDHKNIHAVHIRHAGDLLEPVAARHFLITVNHFKEALLTQLDLLGHLDEGTTVTRPAEHRFLAALGSAMFTGTFPQTTENDHEEFARIGSEA
ncbi:Gfo/Idh/MocA family oxidoreductase [Amycolatopsis sp. NPDC052450]|uniref:Gfo/Idh/MocA family oxidoreductase n=1 Tax=Amycolatopsis sp. NPDC052450 TaxID=3363937 RepID=UPI0037C6394B